MPRWVGRQHLPGEVERLVIGEVETIVFIVVVLRRTEIREQSADEQNEATPNCQHRNKQEDRDLLAGARIHDAPSRFSQLANINALREGNVVPGYVVDEVGEASHGSVGQRDGLRSRGRLCVHVHSRQRRILHHGELVGAGKGKSLPPLASTGAWLAIAEPFVSIGPLASIRLPGIPAACPIYRSAAALVISRA